MRMVVWEKRNNNKKCALTMVKFHVLNFCTCVSISIRIRDEKSGWPDNPTYFRTWEFTPKSKFTYTSIDCYHLFKLISCVLWTMHVGMFWNVGTLHYHSQLFSLNVEFIINSNNCVRKENQFSTHPQFDVIPHNFKMSFIYHTNIDWYIEWRESVSILFSATIITNWQFV